MGGLPQRFTENRMLDRLRRYTGFQKLLFFFIPIFCFIAAYGVMAEFGDFFPRWLRTGVSSVTLWLIFNSWAYLIIAAQVHWKEKTKNIAANTVSILLALALFILSFF